MSIFEDIESALKADKRTLFGIIGEPGAGKSTLVEQIKEKFPGDSVAVLPMDGFHLSNKVLIERGIRNIKGAPQTFDALGFVALLERVKANLEEDIFIPVFHREIEESIANEAVITSEVRVVIVEVLVLAVLAFISLTATITSSSSPLPSASASSLSSF